VHSLNEQNRNQYDLNASEAGWGIKQGGEPLLASGNGKDLIGLEDPSGPVSFSVEAADEDADKSGCRVQYQSSEWGMVDSVRRIEDGFYEIVRTWTNRSEEPIEASFRFELSTSFSPDFYLIPCVSYNGNRWGKGGEPKGLTRDGQPWVFAYDRTGIPSATFSENDRHAVGLFVTDQSEDSLLSACSMEQTELGMIHRLYWPEREAPLSYSDRDAYGPGFRKTVVVPPGGTFRVAFYVSVSPVEEANTGWFTGYDRAYSLLERDTESIFTREEVQELSIRFARDSLLQRDEYGTYFNIGLLPEGSHSVKGREDLVWKIREQDRTEIGWCGQNATLARSLMEHGIRSGDQSFIDTGIEVLDTWMRHGGPLPSGLIRITLDGLWKARSHETADVCNLAWGAWQLLVAYETALGVGVEKPEWRLAALGVCDFFVGHYDPERGFGHSWKLDGTPVASDGTGGAFLLIPLLKAFEQTGNEAYLECVIQAYEGYARRDLDRMQCTAGALDTDCVDKETGWPLLKTALDLFEKTGEPHYLKDARKAGYYLLSWCYLYDVGTEDSSEFRQYGFRTYGSTSVSTQHHHLDPWGALIAVDWSRLGRLTGELMWERIAKAAWDNSLLGLSDGNTVIHGMRRPAGSQNEAFFQTRWNPDSDKERGRGSLNDWLVAWPAAFKLISLSREGG